MHYSTISSITYILRTITLSVICCLLSLVSYSQLNFDFQAGRFLLKGQVIDLQTKKAISLANIKVMNSGKGITCDNEGYFSLYVSAHDTLRFSSVGYLAKVIHVSDIDSARYYTLEVQLLHDFIKLKDVTIYPFRTKEEFADAFMEAQHLNEVNIPGIAKPKYSNITPKAKFTNPVSFLYQHVKRKRAANPDFKP